MNAKGQELFSGLEVAFLKVQQLGAQRKAVIFTESRRTQDYLLVSSPNTATRAKSF